ncbi:hypothetical protein [Actinoallomurus rhizosphaericola]|uniref:hypothetical protein n=1 Tax=Actinoallomurus rhizosphaericola TaxID=2952536 RepID=UPI0020937C82|nr:hypothetical protein [Actinoallomurus rhizosphaericola]MCO5997673.1 hypothetical protein [Actinoallomurus rhizosphaericola]
MTRGSVVAAGTGLVLGLLALGPALAPGFTLAYDMVFVPHPVFDRETFGLAGMLPRHVPSDAVVTALAQVVPADLVQKTILLAILVIACASAAALVPSERLTARLAGGVVYAWNPFVAERLLLGQWALLLGYAALPWVVRAAARGEPRRLLLALVPAAIGGFAAMAVSGLVVLVIGLHRPRPGRSVGVGRSGAGRSVGVGRSGAGRSVGVGWSGRKGLPWSIAALLVMSLPWLVPSVARFSGVPVDPAGVAAFAARADTPFGAVGSLLLLGGGWNAETVPPGYGAAVTAVPWLCVVLLALVAYARGGRAAGTRGLGVAALAGLALASLGVVVPGPLRWAIGLWPGFAVLRDGQQYVGPLAVVVAVGVGLVVDRVAGRRPELAALALLVPVALLPGLAWGAGGRLAAVRYPADWSRARAVVAAAPGDVLVLPWEAYRTYAWNGGRRVLDPLPRLLPGRVILNDAVRVGTGGRRDLRMAVEDPRARALDPLVRSGAPLTGALRARGVRYVAVDAPEEFAAWAGRLPGAEPVVAGPDLVLYRIPGAAGSRETPISQWPIAIAWFTTFAALVWSIRLPVGSLFALSSKEP